MPSATSDGAIDACNPGVTVCIRERVGADVTTAFACGGVVVNVDVTKILVGVSYATLARCENSSYSMALHS